RRPRHDRVRGQGLRPAEGPYGDLSRRRIRREFSAQAAAGDRGRQRADRPSGGSGHRCRQDRTDRRRKDLRPADRARRAHPHRRDRHRGALKNPSGGNMMTRAHRGYAIAAAALTAALSASPAFAQAAKIDAADTAWMIGATGLVLMMTIPGLALFYAGMVRKKNVLATMAQSLAATFLISIVWAVIGYTLAFTGEGAFIGTLDRIFLNGVTLDAVSPLAKTIPESLFMIYQMTFAIITVALVAGSVADRLRFAAFLLFCVFWLLLVYVPVAHWVWGGGFLGTYGLIDFAGGTVVHLNAGVAGLVAAYVLGARRGYGSDNLAPYDLTLAVIGTGLLWVGWF